jgi:tetratricopeptide (TPR) repeat protein
MKRIVILLILISGSSLLRAASSTDSLLQLLDVEVAHRMEANHSKTHELDSLKKGFTLSASKEAQLNYCNQLYSSYLSYNTDSAMRYALLKGKLAQELNINQLVTESHLDQCAVFITTGNYKEALDILESTQRNTISPELQSYYYQSYRTLYGAMADFSAMPQLRNHYDSLATCYRDSMMQVYPQSSLSYKMVKCDDMIEKQHNKEALKMLLDTFPAISQKSHNQAIVAYMISKCYRNLGNHEQAKQYLIISAMADIRSAVKEYISLWELANMLYQDGDIDRAYSYLKCSLEDAIFSNARLRAIKISTIFPIIDKAYQLKSQKQRQQMLLSLIAISLLSLFLIITIVYVLQQIKKLRAIRQELSRSNQQLHESNLTLQEVNTHLSETSHIKEVYIGRYMELCSVYIDKMDEYRRTLNKLGTAGKIDDLFAAIKSTKFIDNELKAFYANFDDAFLRLFPSFVEDFNRLLNEKTYPKAGERLNTELRIFALIRLGITDSEKIAHFLRYSITTIYNYRTSARNKAAGARNEFEQKVMQIESAKVLTQPSL